MFSVKFAKFLRTPILKNIFQRLFLCFELFAVQTLPLYLYKVGTGLSTHLDILEEDWQLLSLHKNIHYSALMAILQEKKKKTINFCKALHSNIFFNLLQERLSVVDWKLPWFHTQVVKAFSRPILIPLHELFKSSWNIIKTMQIKSNKTIFFNQ